MRARWFALPVLVIQMAFSPVLGYAAQPRRAVSGSSSSVPDVILHLDKDYCDTASAYKYQDNGSEAKPTEATEPIADRVDSPINFPAGAPSGSKPLIITDPGDSILGQDEVELAPDGSDATRLLVRTLAASPERTPCQKALPQVRQETSSNFSFANASYYLIDIVRWQAVANSSGAAYQVASDHWYLFNFSDAKASHRKFPFTFRPFVTNDLRIVGDARHPQKTNVVFLAISLAPQGDWKNWKANVDISYKLHADKVIPANIQDLQLLINFLVGKTPPAAPENKKPPENDFQGLYASALVVNLRDLPAKLTSTMTATFKGSPSKAESPYCVDVKKALLTAAGKSVGPCSASSASTGTNTSTRSPAAIESGLIVQRLAEDARPKLLRTSYEFPHVTLPAHYGSETEQEASNKPASASPTAVGSDAVGANAEQNPQTNANTNCDPSTTKDPETGKMLQKPCSLTQTIKDEGLYHWDVSIAVPTPGYKEAVFDSNNVVMPKSVTRTNAYAMLDVAPWGEDFVNPPVFGIPHLMTGLPIAGKVFNRPFIGGLGEEVGLTKIFPFSARVFAGVVYNKEFRGAAQTPHRVWKVQYGIELSMTSAISKLKGASGSK